MTYVKARTYLGKSLTFSQGDLTSNEDLVFDGNFACSSINAGTNTVVVGLSCTVSGDISAGVVEIIGTYNGNITASHSIYLANTAVVNGDITAPLIRIEKHSRYQGRISYS
ncbi:MAG: polymer-forming cytoskeletal protein [Leptospirales bacterium]|jgi:cytoskeletal protein CcmA (bactofilin family)